ncbi:hypothetical protein L6452_18905 [Arctium lappa]|uniref:Uncharacterized protein n=1 Tax=Arctium lappa TaxID=4217 RepID=A0ACB9B7Z9_ARCLA|nr:hypothetical protein L6452_18905 [Arctium lappa]
MYHQTQPITAVQPPASTTTTTIWQPEHLPCPRCDSTNTKFCYYNNYNFSQPHHLCKACHWYWTHGDTLRDIPVDGRSRKNAKRSRHSTAAVLSSSSSSHNNNNNYRHIVPTTAAVPKFPFTGDHGGGGVVGMCGSFTSLLSNNNNNQSSGIFGVGVGGFDQDLSFRLGRTIWTFSDGVVGGGHSAGKSFGQLKDNGKAKSKCKLPLSYNHI